MVLLLAPFNNIHVNESKITKEIWEALEKAFNDSGLMRRVSLIRKMINTKLEDYSTVQERDWIADFQLFKASIDEEVTVANKSTIAVEQVTVYYTNERRW
uniref:Uncharacterized protein n=1 Tax=Megaselia scalaris TaxID=36166 RepID=T1H3N4_MEGSC